MGKLQRALLATPLLELEIISRTARRPSLPLIDKRSAKMPFLGEQLGDLPLPWITSCAEPSVRFLQASPCSLEICTPVFGDLTGEDARPTLWRGRARPRQGRRLRLPLGSFPLRLRCLRSC